MNLYEMKGPDDIKHLDIAQLQELAETIRTFLIDNISKTGGHLSSNLGIVELTIALHYVFQSPYDKLLFDVGHQSYVHKILTGRANQFHTLRQYQGLSGFQKRCESEHDVWEAGHSSTSLSAAFGMCVARDLEGKDYNVIPVIGDGALTCGMAMEALNQIGSEKRNMVIIFNDNNMSISQNVGAMKGAFTRLRTSQSYTNLKEDLSGALSSSKVGKTVLNKLRNIKNSLKDNVVDTSIFGEFNLDYIGPVDGHDLKSLLRVLKLAKKHQGPIVVHVITTKGKGYSFAEQDQEGSWHGVPKFKVETGEFLSKTPVGEKSWSQVINDTLLDLAKQNKDIVTITPAMIGGSKLNTFFQTYPERSFDCGIAEEHAMTFAAGLAQSGKRPFISIYSSFLQRAYDQVNHDITRMDLPVVIGIDRCGLVGEDGDTHHGVFDISFLRTLPNIILAQGKDAAETMSLLYTAFQQNHPFALRYPRGNVKCSKQEYTCIPIGTWTSYSVKEISKAIVITYGQDVDEVFSKAKEEDLAISVVNARFFKPLDEIMLSDIMNQQLPVIVFETDMRNGGLSSAILEYCNDHSISSHIIRIGIRDRFVGHGSLPLLRQHEQIDVHTLIEEIKKLI